MELWQLFLGLLVTLIIASAVSYVLKWKFGNTSVIANLIARVNAWWVMILVIFVAAGLGFYAVVILLAEAGLPGISFGRCAY